MHANKTKTNLNPIEIKPAKLFGLGLTIATAIIFLARSLVVDDPSLAWGVHAVAFSAQVLTAFFAYRSLGKDMGKEPCSSEVIHMAFSPMAICITIFLVIGVFAYLIFPDFILLVTHTYGTMLLTLVLVPLAVIISGVYVDWMWNG